MLQLLASGGAVDAAVSGQSWCCSEQVELEEWKEAAVTCMRLRGATRSRGWGSCSWVSQRVARLLCRYIGI